MSEITFSQVEINKSLYFAHIINDQEIMLFYEGLLKNVNPALSLDTRLSDLPKLFQIIEKWENKLTEDFKKEPIKKIAIENHDKELRAIIEITDNESELMESPHLYWNKFRKIGYAKRGQNPTLKDLGYLILTLIYENRDGFETFKSHSNFINYEEVIYSLADGSALAEYLHKENEISESHIKIKAEENQITFKELFNDENNYNKCIDHLAKINIIDANKNYIFGVRKKGVFAALLKVLRDDLSIIRNINNSANLSKILNNEFPGLDLSKQGKTLRNHGSYKIYIKKFTAVFE